jgi:hypothetical protein
MQSLLALAQKIGGLTECFGQAATYCVMLTIARFPGRYIGVKLTRNLFIELQ